MSKTWNGTSMGSNAPMTKAEKIRVAITLVGMALVVFAVSILTWVGQHDQATEGDVWWTVTCPTAADPDRVCLDGSVPLDRVPEWAGGTKQE